MQNVLFATDRRKAKAMDGLGLTPCVGWVAYTTAEERRTHQAVWALSSVFRQFRPVRFGSGQRPPGLLLKHSFKLRDSSRAKHKFSAKYSLNFFAGLWISIRSSKARPTRGFTAGTRVNRHGIAVLHVGKIEFQWWICTFLTSNRRCFAC